MKKKTERPGPHTYRTHTDNTIIDITNDTTFRVFGWKRDHPKKESWWKGKRKSGGPQENGKKSLNKNTCRICKIEHLSKKDYNRDSLWIRRALLGCSYWAHCNCSDIFYSDDDRDSLEGWSQLHFYCQEHMLSQDEYIPPVSPTPIFKSRRPLSKYAGVGSKQLFSVGLHTSYFVFVFVEHQKVALTKKNKH